jgi:uncharacterized membrane protein YgcG
MATPPSGKTTRAPSAYSNRTGEDHLRRRSPYQVNPEVDALLRKIIPDIEGGTITSRGLGNGMVNVPDPAYLQQIAGTIGQSTTDATSLMQLLPDMTLVKNLLVSAILAPKDLDSSEITYSVDRRAFHLPCAGRLLDEVVDHFTNVYNIKALCPDVLEEIIFLTGSYATMVVPENAVDAMINGSTGYSTESYSASMYPLFDTSGEYRSLGILGQGPTAVKEETKGPHFINAMESLRSVNTATRPETCYASTLKNTELEAAARKYGINSLEGIEKTIVITDNYNVAKTAALLEARRRASVNKAIGNAVALEAGATNYAGGGGFANYALGGAQRQHTTFTHAAIVQAIKTNDMLIRPMVGHPLVMRVPSEAVIPVFIQPGKNLGYFVLLDAEGNPLRLANRKDIYNDLSTSNNGTASSTQGASQMIQMTQNLSIGVNPRENPKDPAQMVKIYGQLLEHELKARLTNGIYGPNAKIDVSSDVYQIMLARSLKKQQTQILYVPGELMVYMAFDYAENGTGRSITEQTKIIGAMRAMLGFSNVMAGIKNSVSRQKVTLTLSDNDIDPSKTIARCIDEYTRRRNVTMPFVASDPADMISYINMAGVEFNIEGKGAPAHKVDIEDKQTNRAKVDVELDNMLRDRHYMAYGVTPEAVLASTGADFATSVVTNNQMFAKRVIGYQDQLTPFLEMLVRMICLNSATIMNKFREIVVSTVKDLKKQGDAETDREDIVDRTKDTFNQAQKQPDDRFALKPVGESHQHQPTQTILQEYDTKPDAHTPLTPDEARLVDQIVFQFIDAIKLSLPRPDTATEEAMSKAFDTHSEALEKGLTYYIDAAFLGPSNLGEYAGHLDEIKAAYKSLFMRQWMSQNGFLPELQKIVAVDEDGNPELDIQKAMTEHTELVAAGIRNYLAGIGKVREKIKDEAAQLNQEFPEAGLTGPGAEGGTGGVATGGGSFGGGGGDFGGGSDTDFGGDEPAFGGGEQAAFGAGLGTATPEEPFEEPGNEPNPEEPEETPEVTPEPSNPAVSNILNKNEPQPPKPGEPGEDEEEEEEP